MSTSEVVERIQEGLRKKLPFAVESEAPKGARLEAIQAAEARALAVLVESGLATTAGEVRELAKSGALHTVYQQAPGTAIEVHERGWFVYNPDGMKDEYSIPPEGAISYYEITEGKT